MEENNNQGLQSIDFLMKVVAELIVFVTDLKDIVFDKSSVIQQLSFLSGGIEDDEILEAISIYLVPVYYRIKTLEDEFTKAGINKEVNVKLLDDLLANLNYLFLDAGREAKKNKVANSEAYYKNKIEQLELEINKSKKEIQNAKDLKVERSKFEKNALILGNQLKSYKKDLEKKQKEIDAKENWEQKITITFDQLEDYLHPIEEEKKKLNVLFYVFLGLSIILVVFLFVVEGIAIHKITSQSEFPSFKDYIILFIPVPIAGALLWGFIYQMNRAQRQSVVLAKNIHSIKYVEGLLIAINNLAPTVENGITRINTALDKMIANHLNLKDENCELDLLEEEKKDSMPVDAVLKILKEAKSLASK